MRESFRGIRVDGDFRQSVGGRQRRRPTVGSQTDRGQDGAGPNPSEFLFQQTPAAVRRHGSHSKSVGKGMYVIFFFS